jgi:hypothetical protein
MTIIEQEAEHAGHSVRCKVNVNKPFETIRKSCD